MPRSQLTHSAYSMRHREFVAIVAGIRMEPRPMCNHESSCISDFHAPQRTHTEGESGRGEEGEIEARNDAHVDMHHAVGSSPALSPDLRHEIFV